MRILYLSFNMPWRGGGTFYRVMGFARALVRRGHTVTVIATSPNAHWRINAENWDGVDVVLTPAWLAGKLRTGWDPYEIVARCRWINGRSFDIIHGFESRPVVIYPALYARRQSGSALVLDWCDWFGRGGSVEERPWWIRPFLRPVETFHEERFRRLAHGTTVINSVLSRRAVQLGVPPETIHWLPNGTDVQKVQPVDKVAARRRLQLPLDAPLVGHLGQAFPQDAALIKDAFIRVQRTYPDARLLLIGNAKTDIAGYFAHASAILETGFVTQEEMTLYLAAADLLWLPLNDTVANRGRWPMKINDYMSAGRPVVSTRVGDLVQLFDAERPVGVLTEPDANDFAAKTMQLLGDADSQAVYGENGRFRAENEFAWPLVAANLEAFYRETRQRAKRQGPAAP